MAAAGLLDSMANGKSVRCGSRAFTSSTGSFVYLSAYFFNLNDTSCAPRLLTTARYSGLSITVSSTRSAFTGAVAGAAAGTIAGTVAACAGAGVADGSAVVVFSIAGFGAGFFASSGKSFGASAAQPHSRAIEITIARKILFSISRDRVPTSRIERVTAREAPDAEPDAAQDAVFLDRLHRIHRARRLETAHRREKRRDEALVASKEEECDGARRVHYAL